MKLIRTLVSACALAVSMSSAWAQSAASAPAAATPPEMSASMFRAVQLDYADKVKGLLKDGESPNTVESHGVPLIVYAARYKADEVVKVLADNPDTDLEAVDPVGENALMMAAINQDMPMVQTLLAKDAEVNKKGWSPLHYAASGGDDAIVKLLLDHSAYIDAGSPNGSTPLMMAAAAGHITTVKLLLDEGADLSIKNQLGLNAIDVAKRYNQPDIADGLSKRLAQIDASKGVPAAGSSAATAATPSK
ncbi:ankyrin repeat domain-containing protein [Pararobbsia silviterrae]|uniref:Ankyrin repeat domain-containing protein n=1 Tax=Pararobbsia silviterrae TaxID=1792498 RepID=A0A494X9C1_9BURK|nr:ankyrin repeat domain-containing protein [Pararobbsia silviterrae]RKP44233.1 ankyrin repeat domain-containing protein [Pararobbsia silviterrae]